MHPYNGIIKYKDILIKTYEAQKDMTFFEYILKGLKLVIIEVHNNVIILFNYYLCHV